MDAGTRREVADRLLGAYASRSPLAPLIDDHPGLDLDDAYAIQLLQVESWERDGYVLQGRKVGLTSAAMQRQMGVDQPDYGVLRDDMFYAEHQPIDVERFIAPRVEPEVAFVLGAELRGPGVTTARAAAAVDFVLPALEIIDSRIRNWQISIVDTIADNASSGGVVLGSKPVRLTDIDLRLAGCNLYGNGNLVATGAGGAVLGTPLISLAWLANTIGRHDISLPAGQIVLPGSVTAAQPAHPGDTWSATFAGLGTVTARFERSTA